MIFQHTADWVLGVSPHTGKPKTLISRRMWYGDHIYKQSSNGGILVIIDRFSRIKYIQGQTYAIQPGRGKSSVGRFRLTQIYQADRAGVLSQEEAEAEGFVTPEAFRSVWRSLYGEASLNQPCWRLRLEVVRWTQV